MIGLRIVLFEVVRCGRGYGRCSRITGMLDSFGWNSREGLFASEDIPGVIWIVYG